MRKKIIIGSITLLLAILVGYWASTTLTRGTHKTEVVISKTTPDTPTEQTKLADMTKAELTIRIILYLAVLIIGILVWEKYGLGVYWKTYWMNNPFMQTIVYIGMVNFIIYKFFPAFWWEHLCSWSAVLFYSMIALSLSVKGRIGQVIALLLFLAFIIHLGGWSVEDKVTGVTKRFGGDTAQGATARTTSQGIVPKGTLKYPREGTFENKEVAERVLAGQWDVLAACYRESGGLKQFESDGKVLVYKNLGEDKKTVVSIDRGACMINSLHDARIENHPDANTLVGNLQYAMILYNEGKKNKRGLRPWTPRLTKEELVFEVPVEADGTETNIFVLPYEDITEYSLIPSVATTLIATDLDGVEHTFDIYPLEERAPIVGGLAADRLKSYRFKAKDGKASVVTVTYRYK